jgi:hypothetical protein
MMKQTLLPTLAMIPFLALAGMLPAQQKSTLDIDPQSNGIVIPDDFAGLSFETASILPDVKGHYPYFSADNRVLIRLFKTLGIKSLRIGGNTSDGASAPIPSRADIDATYAFAKAAGAQVIYTVRLRDSKPEDVISTAKYVVDHYKQETLCLTIGNEPSVYEKEYSKYRDDLQQFMGAISSTSPDARFCGPATTPETGAWAAKFTTDFDSSGKVVAVTQHSYPGGDSRKVNNPAAGRELMLSPDFTGQYQKLYDAFVPSVQKSGLSYRIEETNSFYNGGAENVSNTYASALWGLDYLYWWAAHQASGVNFHTGDKVAAEEQQTLCWYAIFWSKPEGLQINPIAYAIKAFDLGSHGKLLPAKVSLGSSFLSAYAVLGADRRLYITLINKDKNAAATVDVNVKAQSLREKPAEMLLAAPGANIAATVGVTLGDSAISSDGGWDEKWKTVTSKKPSITVTVAPASAVVVKLSLK